MSNRNLIIFVIIFLFIAIGSLTCGLTINSELAKMQFSNLWSIMTLFAMGLPLLVIILLRKANKYQALILATLVLIFFASSALTWVALSLKLTNTAKEIASGFAIEIGGAMFTALGIVVLEQVIEKWKTDE